MDAIDGPTGLKGAVPTWFIVPFTLIWGVVVITEYRAQVRRPPEHTGLCLGALLSVGGHSRAEALTVTPRVTGAGVMHAGLIEDRGVHLAVTPFEYTTLDNATLLLCPGATMWVQAAGVWSVGHIWARGSFLPTIPKVQLTGHHHVVPSGEVIFGLVIKVPTQTTYSALVRRGQFDEDGGPLVPDNDNARAGLHHQVQAHFPCDEGHMVPLLQLLYDAMFIHQLQLCSPYKDLYGLGAGNTCGAAGDVLRDNAEGAGRVLTTVVLDSHIGAVSVKVIVLSIEGDVVATAIDRAGAVACIPGALPASFLAGTGVVTVQFDSLPRIV